MIKTIHQEDPYEDPYEEFSKVYDKFSLGNGTVQEEFDFYERVFSGRNISTILDCACGTGYHCCQFYKKGYNIYGCDISKAMLIQARKNLKEMNIEIELKNGDFRNLEDIYDNKFDAVLCLSTSLPHVHTEEGILKALTSMKNVLRDNGIVIIYQGITHSSLKPENRIQIAVDTDDFIRISLRDIHGDIQTITVIDVINNINNQKTLETYSVDYKMLFDNDYQVLLQQAGFKNIQIFGDFKQNEYDPNVSTKIIVVAEK